MSPRPLKISGSNYSLRSISSVLLLASISVATAVNLAWNASISPGIKSYAIYYGPASRAYTNAINVGNVLDATVGGLPVGSIQYFAVTCSASNGLQSDFSDEIVYTVPQTNIVLIGQPTVAMNWFTNKAPLVSWAASTQGLCDTLQASTNLINWSNIARSFYRTNAGRIEVGISTNFVAVPNRFFRVTRGLNCL
jgi:hypothetical protein